MKRTKSKTVDPGRRDPAPRALAVRSLLIPTAVILAILHAAIIISIVSINQNSARLSAIMQDFGDYSADATSLLAGSRLLSETSSNYVLMPFDESGEPNVGVLVAYTEELKNPRRGHDVSARFAHYEVGADAAELLNAAAASAERMNEAQSHAIELVRSVYPLPAIPALDALPRYSLSEEEASLTNEEKLDRAIKLVFGGGYTADKASVSQNVNACVSLLQREMQQKAGEASAQIASGRRMLWAMTLSIIAVLLVVFVLFYRLLVLPLTHFARGIDSDEALEERRGLREVRLLAGSYNALRKRRNLTERFLRSAANTDALTGLPNRFSFNHYLLEHENTGDSVGIVLFDVNNLKIVNDTKGHLAGDKLICDAAECISDIFDPAHSGRCFRIGGDEFAVCITNETQETFKHLIDEFLEEQTRRGIGIAYGHAYGAAGEGSSFDDLFEQADRSMYEMKEKMHVFRTQ